MVARGSPEGRGMILRFKRQALHTIYESTFSTTTFVFLGQRLLSPNKSKFEIHVVSFVVVLAQDLVKKGPDLVRSP